MSRSIECFPTGPDRLVIGNIKVIKSAKIVSATSTKNNIIDTPAIQV